MYGDKIPKLITTLCNKFYETLPPPTESNAAKSSAETENRKIDALLNIVSQT